MKIAYVSYEYPPDTSFGGIATYVKQAAELMVKRGHYVEVFTATTIKPYKEVVNGVYIHRILEVSARDFSFTIASTFLERHLEIQFDVFEAPEYYAEGKKIKDLLPEIPYVLRMHTPNSVLINLIYSQFKLRNLIRGAKDIIYLIYNLITNYNSYNFDLYPRSFTIQKKFWDTLERKEANRADIVASPSNSLINFVTKTWKIQSDKVFLSPHPYIPEQKYLDIRSNTNMQYNLVIGYIGRLEERKGIKQICKTIPLIVKKYPEVKFRFIGKSLLEPESKMSYDKWIMKIYSNYVNNIEVIGHIDYNKIPDEIAKIDIAILPSLWENFPNSCLEMMSAGKAIVGSKYGGMNDMLNGGECGIVVDPKNKNEMINALLKLISDPQLRKDYGLKARKRILDYYNENVIGSQIEKLFELAIKKKCE